MKYIFIAFFLILTISNKVNSQSPLTNDSVPVRVSYLNATQNNNKTRLNWKVVCYLTYANFEIQRSINGFDYVTINSFIADRIRCLSPFDFDDAISSARTYYRLKVGDKDGNFSTSKIVVAFGKENSFEINSITPSLIANSTLLSISSAENDKADISIINMQGNIVKRLPIGLIKGITDIKLDVSALTKGIYIIRITNSTSDFRVKQIAKL